MSTMELQSLLLEGEKLVAALELDTAAFHTELNALREEDVGYFVTRRQKIVTAIQNFDSDCSRFKIKSSSPLIKLPAKLAELRERLVVALDRVITADRLLIALAELEKARITDELASIALGHQALSGYGTKERRSSSAINHIA